MRLSNFFLSTLREAPADADVVSQKLMLRAGMIKKLAAGIYTYMPMGLRSIRKIENIIREEMNAAKPIELSCDIQRIFLMKNYIHTMIKPQREPEKYRQADQASV